MVKYILRVRGVGMKNNNNGVKIQCPDCGGLIKIGADWDGCDAIVDIRCDSCFKEFTEDEIRRRCGI